MPLETQRKVVPQIIDQYLSPLALAVWIMDDATLHKNKGLRFCTNCFTLKEVQYLASVLEKKYGLNTSIHKTGVVNQYGLYIPKSSMADLTKIVKPYIHPTMLYKLPSI
jgi:ubiquinol-cytochrome c reductase cytochrome b subunit